jgi:putative hemolysin
MNEGSNAIFTDLLLILLLILVNAFFAASELAIVSLNKNKINLMASEGDKKAHLLSNLMKEPSKFLATIQVGITLAGFLASASAAVSISKVFAQLLNSLNVPFIAAASERISLIAVTIILAFFTLVLGELLPKRLALQNAESIAMFAVKPIVFISKFTGPFVKILTLSTNFFARLLGSTDENLDEKVTEEEIRLMFDVGEESGILNKTEREMLDGIFEFDDTLAREVMTPRTNVFTVDIDTSVEEIIDTVVEEQYSRVPVYQNDTDNIIGILYMKDLFPHIRKHDVQEINIRDILRPAYFVPETKNIDTLFRELQHNKNHIAILIDEYGGFSGILTIEDLMEEIFGNIADEYDEDVKDIEKIDKNTYIINGLVSIDDINDRLHLKVPSENFDTIGGFVVDLLGNIPREDEEHIVEYENLTFKVEKVDEKRIEKLKLYINQ